MLLREVVHLETGMRIDRDEMIRRFVGAFYVNDKVEFRGHVSREWGYSGYLPRD